jgi:hypothetical protein
MEIDLSEFFSAVDQRCALGKFIGTMTEDEQATIKAAFEHPDISLRSIVEWLRKRNYATSTTSVGTHFKGLCRCG